MKLKVEEDICISCGACAAVCPECFEVEDTAKVTVDKIPDELIDSAKDAMEGCPVGAIVEVTDENK